MSLNAVRGDYKTQELTYEQLMDLNLKLYEEIQDKDIQIQKLEVERENSHQVIENLKQANEELLNSIQKAGEQIQYEKNQKEKYHMYWDSCAENLKLEQDKTNTYRRKLEQYESPRTHKKGLEFYQVRQFGHDVFKNLMTPRGKVLMYMIENSTPIGWCFLTQNEITEGTGLHKPDVSKFLKELSGEDTKLTNGGKPALKRVKSGRGWVYAINPQIYWQSTDAAMQYKSAYATCEKLEDGVLSTEEITVKLKVYSTAEPEQKKEIIASIADITAKAERESIEAAHSYK